MSAAPQINPTLPNPNQIHHLEKKPVRIIPVKVGWMGEQGSGKTASAGLLAAALSMKFHGGAPIHVTDPELGWDFLDPVIFQKEKIKLVQSPVPTFEAMLQNLHRAKREGACVWAVELGKIWIEIIRTLQKAKPDNWGMNLRSMWDDFVAQFLNSELHCLVLGRIQDVIEEILLENGATKSIKVGEGMKAGGQKNNFGYEPHLVIRMSLEQKPRLRKIVTLDDNGRKVKTPQLVDEGRMVHRALITKDRSWALNGKTFRWPDRDGYKPGDFKYVWQSLAPHFEAVQLTRRNSTLDTVATSGALIDDDGNSEYYANRQKRDVFSAEIKACLDLHFAGQGREDKQVRIAVSDLIFGVKSKEAADALPLEKLERGLRILHAYEKIPVHDMTSRDTVLVQIHDCIAEYDRGESEEWDTPLPF